MPMPKRKRGSNASDASEKLVLDQCALFALQRVVSAVQDREVSSQEILGALWGAATGCRRVLRVCRVFWNLYFFWNLYWYRFGCSPAKYGAHLYRYGQHEGTGSKAAPPTVSVGERVGLPLAGSAVAPPRRAERG